SASAGGRHDRVAGRMSAIGPKQTWPRAVHMSAFGGKADMTICACLLLRSLLGVKRTCRTALHMSAFDPKRTCGLNSTAIRELPGGLTSEADALGFHRNKKEPGEGIIMRQFALLAAIAFAVSSGANAQIVTKYSGIQPTEHPASYTEDYFA